MAEDLKISMDKFKLIIDEFSEKMFQSTHIYMGHPTTLLQIDMTKIPNNRWFISHQYVEEGCVLLIKDEDMKRDLYKFCEEHPDRIFKGSK